MQTDPETIKPALNKWSASFDNLSRAFQSYFSASAALDHTYSIAGSYLTIDDELEGALVAIDSKLNIMTSWAEELTKNRISLSKIRNNSTSLSPINKLPPEVLGHIFSLSRPHCIFDESDDSMYSEPSSVCTYWRQVALSRAELWTYIDMSLNAPIEFGSRLLERSRDRPIHIHVHEYEAQEDRADEETDDIIAALMPHIHRISSLSIKLESETSITSILTAWLEHGSGNLAKKLSIDRPRNSIRFYYTPDTIEISRKWDKILRSLDILHLGYIDFGWGSSVYRNLTDLRLVNRVNDQDHPIWLPYLYDMLNESPRLVTLKLVWLAIVTDEEPIQKPRIKFEHLRVLNVESMEFNDLKYILPLIALPESPSDLSIGISIGTREAVDMITEFLGHRSLTTLYLSVEDGHDYEPVICSPLRNPSALPQTLILSHTDLEEVLSDGSELVSPVKSILGSIPNLVLYDCVITEGTLERLIIRYNVQTLWLDTCDTLTDGEDIADIQVFLSERYPELKWRSTDTYPEGPDPCRRILDMFD